MNYFPAEGQVSRELSPSISITPRIEAVDKELLMSLPQRRALHAASAKGGKKCANHELFYPFLVAFLKLASTRTILTIFRSTCAHFLTVRFRNAFFALAFVYGFQT